LNSGAPAKNILGQAGEIALLRSTVLLFNYQSKAGLTPAFAISAENFWKKMACAQVTAQAI
jgi:hypothetical protein